MPDEQPNQSETATQPADKPSVDAQPSGKMHVKVYAPFKVYFDGDATSISAVNDTGPFDVLSKHHNFMTLLNEGDIVVRSEQGEERVKITRGIMHVKADDVVVFLDV